MSSKFFLTIIVISAKLDLVGGPADLSLYDSLLRDFKGHAAYLQGPNKQSFLSSYSSGGLHNTDWAAFREKWGQGVYYVPDIDDTQGFNTSDPGESVCTHIRNLQLMIETGFWAYWGDVIDGSMSWETAWPAPDEPSAGSVAIDNVVAAGNAFHLKSYMMRKFLLLKGNIRHVLTVLQLFSTKMR